MPSLLRLSTGQLDSIIEHARARKPEEACGILAGDSDGTVRKVFLVENVERSSTFYMMDSQEQYRVLDEIERENLELLAIFHSHPHSPAIPSSRDCELAFYPDSLYMIISLADDTKPESRAYVITDDDIKEAEIVITNQ